MDQDLLANVSSRNVVVVSVNVVEDRLLLFYCNCVGPSKDASTGEVIWRHRALDADGICSPGRLTYGNVRQCLVGLFSCILRN